MPVTSPSSVVLAMIVKDEADVIERGFRSVRPLPSAWVLVDTGSTDRTPEIVRETMRDTSTLADRHLGHDAEARAHNDALLTRDALPETERGRTRDNLGVCLRELEARVDALAVEFTRHVLPPRVRCTRHVLPPRVRCTRHVLPPRVRCTLTVRDALDRAEPSAGCVPWFVPCNLDRHAVPIEAQRAEKWSLTGQG